jgi:hypothetical protein
MTARTITRGSTVVFAVAFLDADGNPTTPPSANLYVAYRKNGAPQLDTIALTSGSPNWTGEWFSGNADGGRVDWHVRSAGSEVSALEGSFILEVNAANPNPS